MMSIIPTSGVVVSAAGVGLAQTGGAHAMRSQHAATMQQLQIASQLRAEDTAGIAATDGEDQQAHDRDADGRREWQFGGTAHRPPTDQAASDADAHAPKDPSGDSGNQLDLTG